MDEPWLDSLSEDWNSQTSFPPAPILTGKTPAKPKLPNSYHDRTSFENNHDPQKSLRPKPGANQRRALLERCDSDTNIPSSPSSLTSSISRMRHSQKFYTSTISSAGSVLRRTSFAPRKSRSSSPHKIKSRTTTPEWKRLLRQGSSDIMVHNDLFSPINLEGIFRRPEEDGGRQMHIDPLNLATMLGNGFYDVPSSPPPGLGFQEKPFLTLGNENASTVQSMVDVTTKEGNSKDEPLNSVSPQELCWNSTDLVASDEQRSAIRNAAQGAMTKTHSESASETVTGGASSLNDGDGALEKEPVLQRNGNIQSPQSSLASNGFSPVFISKHNTAAGDVDYNALDFSNPEVIRQWKDFRSPIPTRSNYNAVAVSCDVKRTNEANCEINDANVRANEAFCSLDSSSIVPSDSVSQLNADPGFYASDRTSVALHKSADDSTLKSEPNDGHTSPDLAGNKLRQIDGELSTASPLKLFGDHDTCTDGKLLNRLMQPDEIESINIRDVPNTHRAYVVGEMSEDQHLPHGVPMEEQSSVLSAETTLRSNDFEKTALISETENWAREDRSCLYELSLPLILGNAEGAEVVRTLSSPAFESGLYKRSARSPYEQPISKRQRTLCQWEMIQAAEHVSCCTEAQNHRTDINEDLDCVTVNIQDDKPMTSDEDLGSPKPASSHTTLGTCSPHSRSDSINPAVTDVDRLNSIREHIEEIAIPCAPKEAFKIKALASEVATIDFRGIRNTCGSTRKQSVSTQDYVDEAMKIMDFIRSKRVVQASGKSAETFNIAGLSHTFNESDMTSPETTARLSSKDEWNEGWQSRTDKELDPRVISHLRKYEEVADESFRMSSALQLPDTDDLVNNDVVALDDIESQPTKIRIINSKYLQHESKRCSEPIQTHSSDPSSGSSGRTVQTQSSQRTRLMPVIAPGKVSHLISSIEFAAGMRFDREKQTWLKEKRQNGPHKRTMTCSSSVGTEDDVLGNIPDLSINDIGGLVDINNESSPVNGCTMLNPSENREEMLMSPKGSPRSSIIERGSSILPNDIIPISAAGKSNSTEGSGLSAPCMQVIQPSTSYNEKQDLTTGIHHERKCAQATGVYNLTLQGLKFSADDLSKYADDELNIPKEETIYLENNDYEGSDFHRTIRSQDKKISSRRPMFSSAPVSREYLSQTWHEDTESIIVPEYDGDHPDEIMRNQNDRGSSKSRMAGSLMSRVARDPSNPKRLISTNPNRIFSISRFDEHHEVSLIGTRLDGRSMSLTFSISTPLPARGDRSIARFSSNNVKIDANLQSLSPLSEFTVHQDDACHLESRHLLHGHQAADADHIIKSAGVVTQLVTKLTDVEPDEPYWDALRTLNLNGKQLTHLHTLEEFCPSLEDLDVSSNRLANLNGIPRFVRQLHAQDNGLSDLTNWEHLLNLQYLDISSNEVDNLDGLGNLVHLRELKVDDNKLSSVDGIFDLDGLLSLSARGNKLSHIDFQSADLRRLSKLDVGKNDLVAIDGLACLSKLNTLVLDHNELAEFPIASFPLRTLQALRSLTVAHNHLRSIDALQLPNLQYLDADNNKIGHIDNLAQLRHMQSLKLRHQELDDEAFDNPIVLGQFRGLRNLYLSGNTITSFPITFQFLNLHTLELAFAGLQELPTTFGMLLPSLRALNLNSNALKDLKPLRGLSKLKRLMVAGNRLSRLRKTLRVIRRFPALVELDLRNNHFSIGFYPCPTSVLDSPKWADVNPCSEEDFDIDGNSLQMQHVLPPADPDQDQMYVVRLDEDTRLRRRVYELLLAVECKALQRVDGLQWNASEKVVKDRVWDTLLALGIVVRMGDGMKEGGLLQNSVHSAV